MTTSFHIETPGNLFSVAVFATIDGRFASELAGQEGKYRGMHWTSPAMGNSEAAAEYARTLAASMAK